MHLLLKIKYVYKGILQKPLKNVGGTAPQNKTWGGMCPLSPYGSIAYDMYALCNRGQFVLYCTCIHVYVCMFYIEQYVCVYVCMCVCMRSV